MRDLTLLAAAFASALASTAGAQHTALVSATPSGASSDGASISPAISADGRRVVFVSSADNLAPGDPGAASDVYLAELGGGPTALLSVSASGAHAGGTSNAAAISADGGTVAFVGSSDGFVPGDANGRRDVFVRHLASGTLTCASVTPSGTTGGHHSEGPLSLSADGRYVAFLSLAEDLVPGQASGPDVFVRDLLLGTTVCASTPLPPQLSTWGCFEPDLSYDGRYVAMTSQESGMLPFDANGIYFDVLVRDLATGALELASVSTSGVQADSSSEAASISADGRYVAFASRATNLVPEDPNPDWDVYLRDRVAGTTVLVSRASSGAVGNGDDVRPAISADGRYVAFDSTSGNLVPDDWNAVADVFVRDLASGTTVRVSVTPSQAEVVHPAYAAAISADGQRVAFASPSPHLASGDSNGAADVFLHDRAGGAVPFCEPGLLGVAACPCLNPAAGPGKGCENSSLTGGAALVGHGFTTLAFETLELRSSGQKPSSTTLVIQGDSLAAGGAVFGQGIRCVGGSLLRLDLGVAQQGSFVSPAPATPSISARSAALGDPLAPGDTRYYFLFYRDPIVQGGCPATATFNATNAVAVDWR